MQPIDDGLREMKRWLIETRAQLKMRRSEKRAEARAEKAQIRAEEAAKLRTAVTQGVTPTTP